LDLGPAAVPVALTMNVGYIEPMRTYLLLPILFSSIFGISPLAFGVDEVSEPVSAQLRFEPQTVQPEQIVSAKVQLQIADGYKVYLDNLNLKSNPDFPIKISKFQSEDSKKLYDRFSNKERDILMNQALVTATVELANFKSKSSFSSDFFLTYQACTEKFCLFPKTIKLNVQFDVANDKSSESKLKLPPMNIFGYDIPVSDNLLMIVLVTFIMGILTSFTPCVFPMIPITIAILGRESGSKTKLQSFIASNVYVLGIATSFSSLGILAASTGKLFGSYMNHPIVLSVVCAVLILMILSMIGVLNFQAPQKLQNYFSSPHAGFGGVFITGIGAGVIASPCVGPVIVSILTYVATTQNTMLGFLLLFVYAIGFGQLFLFIGLSSNFSKKLPKSGRWMTTVKYVIAGFLALTLLHYASLLKNQFFPKESPFFDEHQVVDNPEWQNFTEESLAKAISDGKPVIIDFFADWCGACIQLEKQTFSDKRVIELSKDFVMFRFDATNPSPQLDELQKRYKILGLPTVILYSKKGQWLTEMTLTEFVTADKMLERMNQILAEK
jgi:thiol:disulfide interchange protein DsbD